MTCFENFSLFYIQISSYLVDYLREQLDSDFFLDGRVTKLIIYRMITIIIGIIIIM